MGAADVDDRIDGADLVEVDLVDIDPVHTCLGLRQQLEGASGPVAHEGVQVGIGQHRVDRGPRPMVVVIGRPHVDGGRGQPTATSRRPFERPAIDGQPLELCADRRLVGAHVEQRGQHHVAGHADRRVEPECTPFGVGPGHGVPPSSAAPRMRSAAQAAP